MDNYKIQFKNISIEYEWNNGILKVLNNINMNIKDGEFVSIIGPSGCGKSTLFHILTQIEPRYTGSIYIEGVPLNQYKKKMSYMHQKDLLMPWRTMMDNVVLPLELQGVSKKKAYEKFNELLPAFGLEKFEKAYPNEMSGGMKKRASLFRTIMVESDIMLLDEPFGALDAINRLKMQEWLLKIWRQFKHTVLFVTHDIEEAIFLSDRIYVLSDRPARVIKEIDIKFLRPRGTNILTSDEFFKYKKVLLEALK